jgi:uncharacterized protein
MSVSKKKTLVMGASNNPERYSYLAINRLRHFGHPVVAIGRKAAIVGDVTIDIDQEPYQNIDTVTLYLAAQHQQEYYDYLLKLQPKRIVFNPGAENKELALLAKNNGIQAIEACTLVLLATDQF